MNEAKQALADCPTYHRIPLHFRNTASVNTPTPPMSPEPVEIVELDLSMHAPDGQQEETLSQHPQDVTINLEPEPTETGTSLEELITLIKPRRGPGCPKGSRTRSKRQAQTPPEQTNPIISTNQRSTRSQVASQTAAQEHTISKKRRMGEPEKLWTNSRTTPTGSISSSLRLILIRASPSRIALLFHCIFDFFCSTTSRH